METTAQTLSVAIAAVAAVATAAIQARKMMPRSDLLAALICFMLASLCMLAAIALLLFKVSFDDMRDAEKLNAARHKAERHDPATYDKALLVVHPPFPLEP